MSEKLILKDSNIPPSVLGRAKAPEPPRSRSVINEDGNVVFIVEYAIQKFYSFPYINKYD